MRPTYETEEDLKSERAVAAKLEGRWKCRLVKLAKYSPVDYATTRDGKVVGFVEIRIKNYTYNEVQKFGDIIIDTAKLIAFKDLRMVSNMRVALVIALKDSIIYSTLEGHHGGFPQFLRERNDEGSERDTVVLSKIPIELFHTLKMNPSSY